MRKKVCIVRNVSAAFCKK